jgi:hypothetical protein
MVLACMILVYAPKFGEAACFCPLGVLLVWRSYGVHM